MRPADLHIVLTSPGCISYRLLVAGRIVWSNRGFADIAESHAAVRGRMEAWAQQHGYRVVEADPERSTRRAS